MATNTGPHKKIRAMWSECVLGLCSDEETTHLHKLAAPLNRQQSLHLMYLSVSVFTAFIYRKVSNITLIAIV